MLRFLLEHPGRLVTKAELRQHVWAGTHVADSVLRASVQEIRAALDDSAAAPQYLETVGRQGYRLPAESDLDGPSRLLPGPIVGRQREVDWHARIPATTVSPPAGPAGRGDPRQSGNTHGRRRRA